MKLKKISGDLVYSIGAVLIFNIILQVVIYPFANKQLGSQEFGNAVFWMGIINAVAGAVGLAINHERLIAKKLKRLSNGDCIFTLLFYLAVADILFSLYVILSGYSGNLFGMIIALSLNIVRNYSDVEFRLTLNYKGYFGYYMLLSIGYLMGLLLFVLFGKWILILCIGELFPVIYVMLKGNIYKVPFGLSSDKFAFFKAASFLIASDLIYALLQYWDRIVLLYLADSKAVSVYYVGTLIGKTLIIALSPLSNLVLSYLGKSEKVLSIKDFCKILCVAISFACVGYIACNIVSPIFIQMLYPEYAEILQPILWLLNLGQILAVLAYFLNYILLSVGSEKWQVVLRGGYAVIMISFSYIGTIYGNIEGLGMAVVLANLLQIIFIICIVFANIQKNNKRKGTDGL